MTESTTATSPVTSGWRRAPRWVLGALVGSLSVNLLVLGLAFGAMWHVRSGQAMGGGNLLGNLSAFSQTLPADRRSELAPLIIDPRQQPELRAQREEVRLARREVMRQFKADPFDAAAFRAAEARAAEVEGRIRNAVDDLAANLAQRLTAAERAKFLKWRDLRRGRMRPYSDDERSGKGRPTKSP